MLDELQKQLCRTVGPTPAASREPLGHHKIQTSLSVFCRYYLGRYSSDLTELILLPYSCGSLTRNPDGLHDFSVNIFRYYMLTVSPLAQQISGILCLQNDFLLSMI